MTSFSIDTDAARRHFEAHGWVHVRRGATPELVDHLRALLAESRARDPLRGAGLKGAKEQFLFETADMAGFCTELFDVVSAVCGTRRETMTLSERHLKVYEHDADPFPTAHKDRFSSLISVGVAIEIPPESRLVLYPHDRRDVNRFLTTGYRDSLAPDELPEVALTDAQPVEIADEPGDVVLFYGSSMWHLRRHSAGAALLYVKVNDFDSDPLGEDPTTPVRRQGTIEALDRAGHTTDGLVPVVGRRFQSVTHEYGRDLGDEWWVTVFAEPPTRASARALELLRKADGTRTWRELVGDDDAAGEELRRLARIGAIDLLDAVPDAAT